MKHFFRDYFFVLPVAIALLTGCSTEQEIVDTDNGSIAKGKITFAFPMSKGATSYSTIAATEDESFFTTDDMTIYMVNASDTIESIFSGSSLTGSESSTTQVATIQLPNEATSDKKFYFVANTASVTSALSSITVDSSLADLLTVVTEVQSAHLSSSDGLLLTGSVTVTADALAAAIATPISVTLRRRVARFDISNDAATSMVTIKKVLISNAKTTALAFADKDSLPKTKGNLPDIDFTAITGANAGINQSVFYLYPSDSVVIQLLTDVGGVEQLFKLPLPEGGIKANKSYTIKAKYNATKPSFDLVPEDWTLGEEIEAVSNSSVEIVSLSVPATQQEWWDAQALTYDVNGSGTTITLTTSTLSSAGATVEVVDAPAGYTITATPSAPTLTYAAGYRQTVTITVPPYTGAAPLNAKVVIKDLSNPAQSKTVNVVRKDYYPTAHKGWAGCNIYYDEDKGHLTFDDVGVTEHEQYQGVYFKWGSLWGISPKGAWSGDVRLYPPAGDTISAKDRLSTFDWKKIVPFVDTLLLNPTSGKDRRDWAYLYQITNGETGKGDICKWLTQKGWAPTGKKWRLPTSNEFGESQTVHSYGDFVADTSDPAVSAGTNLIRSGRSLTNVTPNLFFPASGYRNSSTGALSDFGSGGYTWSDSPYSSATNGQYLSFYSSNVNPALNGHRAFGFTVRCVVE